MADIEEAGGFDYARQHWDELPQDEWLGVTSEGIVAKASDPRALREMIQGLPEDAEPPVVVLRHDGKAWPTTSEVGSEGVTAPA